MFPLISLRTPQRADWGSSGPFGIQPIDGLYRWPPRRERRLVHKHRAANCLRSCKVSRCGNSACVLYTSRIPRRQAGFWSLRVSADGHLAREAFAGCDRRVERSVHCPYSHVSGGGYFDARGSKVFSGFVSQGPCRVDPSRMGPSGCDGQLVPGEQCAGG